MLLSCQERNKRSFVCIHIRDMNQAKYTYTLSHELGTGYYPLCLCQFKR